MKILYFEDDAINRLIVAQSVKGHYEIDAAETPQEGLELAEKNTYDVFLIDINLNNPEMDGIDVLNKLREMPHQKDSFFIAHTNYFGEDWKKRCLESGFDYYFPKPFMLKMFNELINK